MGHFESVVPLDTVFAIARPQNHVKIFAQQKGARNGEVSGEPLKPGRFPAFVCVRRPVVAILGPRYSLGMDDLDNSVISRGGMVYTGEPVRRRIEIPVKCGSGDLRSSLVPNNFTRRSSLNEHPALQPR